MSTQKPGRGSDQFPLRLPDGMRDRIKAEAERNGRSMNAEIVARLEDSLNNAASDFNPYVFVALDKSLDLLMAQTDFVHELAGKVSGRKDYIDKNIVEKYEYEAGKLSEALDVVRRMKASAGLSEPIPPIQSQKQGDDTPE